MKYVYTGILTQHTDGTDHPITYVSRLFHGSQLNWATLTKEAYTIYMSVKKLSFYIDTAKITVKSEEILEKNTTKELPPVTTQVVEEVIKCEIGNINIQHTDPVQIETDITLPLKDEKLVKLQESNPYTQQLRKQWENNNLDKNAYIIENDILKRKTIQNRLLYTPIVVPDILKDCLLILAHHKSGHNRFRRTYASLKNRYHWKGMKKSIHQHCTNCQVCAKHHIKTQQLKNEHFSSPPQPMEFIAMDLIGEFHPASSKGNR